MMWNLLNSHTNHQRLFIETIKLKIGCVAKIQAKTIRKIDHHGERSYVTHMEKRRKRLNVCGSIDKNWLSTLFKFMKSQFITTLENEIDQCVCVCVCLLKLFSQKIQLKVNLKSTWTFSQKKKMGSLFTNNVYIHHERLL